MHQKSDLKPQNLTWKYAQSTGSVRNKNETAVLNLRSKSEEGFCLADSEAQGSAVRQFLLCYRLDSGHSADATEGEPKSPIGNWRC
jgi:hypothetical protein